MMHAVVGRAGALDSIAIAQVPRPDPAAGELRLRVRAVGVNPADWKVVARGIGPTSAAGTLGLDAAGTVDALGPDTEGPPPGTRVCVHTGLARLGAFAQWLVVPAASVAVLPDALDDERAAVLPTAGFTAWQILRDRVRLTAADAVLVLGGSGALGGFAIGGARALGARVAATASRGRDGVARAAGAQAVFDGDLEPAALAAAAARWNGGRPVDVLIDTTGGERGAQALRHAGYGAHYVACNGPARIAPPAEWPRGVSVHDVFLGGALATGHAADTRRVAALGAELAGYCARGEVVVPPFEPVAFDGIPDLLRTMAAGQATGKRVARVG